MGESKNVRNGQEDKDESKESKVEEDEEEQEQEQQEQQEQERQEQEQEQQPAKVSNEAESGRNLTWFDFFTTECGILDADAKHYERYLLFQRLGPEFLGSIHTLLALSWPWGQHSIG